MKRFKFKTISLLVLAGLLLVMTACGNSASSDKPDEKKELTIAFAPGNYVDQFNKGIKPILEKKGYKVTAKVFSQTQQLNPAMKAGEIDGSVFQSTAYMKSYNKDQGTDMTALNYVPSAPQAMFSTKHKSLDDVKSGMTVAVPNDAVNTERAAQTLKDLGWVKIKEDAGTSINFNINSVLPGKYNIKFVEMDAAQILRSLDDVDYGITNGNFVVASQDFSFAKALKIENTPLEHRIIFSLNKKNKDTQWAKDIKAAYASKSFQDYINSNKDQYEGFIMPIEWEK